MKLTVELVPTTSWYTNVRSEVTPAQWDVIRKEAYAKAGHKCEICEETGLSQGYGHAVECHEIWHYDDDNLIQRLEGFIALCPECHLCKHPGLAAKKGQTYTVIAKLAKVNKITPPEAVDYLVASFTKHRERSLRRYKLNIDFINPVLNH